MLKTSVGRLRVVGFVEGVSYLLLLGVAMPWRAITGDHLPVRVTGAVHGVLYVLFAVAAAQAASVHGWWWRPKVLVGVFLASVVPFGTFALDRWLRREEEAASGTPAPSSAAAP